MKALWVDAGNELDPALARKHGIDEPYFDVRDPRVTDAYLHELEREGFKPGIYACWNWDETKALGGAAFAQWTSDQLKRFTPNTPTHPRVHLNNELHEPGVIAAMLQRWRQLRPTRTTLWTMEGHQAPLFYSIRQQIIDSKVDIGPQCYVQVGAETQRIESAGEVKAWAALGVPVARIFPFYAASMLGAWWDGVAFAQGSLPA